MSVVWEEPPMAQRGGKGTPRKWFPLLIEVAERPNCWARIETYASDASAYNAVWGLRKGLHPIPAGDWEFAARKTDEGCSVYARFLGNNGDGS